MFDRRGWVCKQTSVQPWFNRCPPNTAAQIAFTPNPLSTPQPKKKVVERGSINHLTNTMVERGWPKGAPITWNQQDLVECGIPLVEADTASILQTSDTWLSLFEPWRNSQIVQIWGLIPRRLACSVEQVVWWANLRGGGNRLASLWYRQPHPPRQHAALLRCDLVARLAVSFVELRGMLSCCLWSCVRA